MNRLIYAGSLVFSCIIILLTFLPLLLDWKLLSNSKLNSNLCVDMDNSGNSICNKSRLPLPFRDSLVAGIAAAIPAIIDCVADTIYSRTFDQFRLYLVIGAVLPNLIFLSSNFTPELLVVLFRLRFILCSSICFIELNILGFPNFHRSIFILMGVSSIIAAVFSCWLSFSTNFINILSPIFYTTFSFSSFLLIYFIFFWTRNLLNEISNRPITNNERKCSVYLLAMTILSIGFFILACVYGPFITDNTSYDYLSLCTYFWSIFMISIWFFHGRFIRLEQEQAQVSYIH